jgi:hypothetical protein
LCAECYAPRALAAELTRLLQDLTERAAADSWKLYSAHDLSPQIRALLSDSCWHHVRSEFGADVARCLTAHDLPDWLRAVQETRACYDHDADADGRPGETHDAPDAA